jgi:hypothetical protein
MTDTPTNKNSGSGEELEKILYTFQVDSSPYLAQTSQQLLGSKAKALAAIRAYTQRQVLQARIDELETAWGKYAPGNLGNGYMAKRVATLTQQLKDMEDTNG